MVSVSFAKYPVTETQIPFGGLGMTGSGPCEEICAEPIVHTSRPETKKDNQVHNFTGNT